MTPKELDEIRKDLGLSVNAFAKAIYRQGYDEKFAIRTEPDK